MSNVMATSFNEIYRTMEVAEPSNLPPLIALQEWLLQAVTADLMFWLLADEQTLDNSSDQKELAAGVEIPSGKLTELWKDPPFSMGKSTINHHFQ